jgi:hypothetical protein
VQAIPQQACLSLHGSNYFFLQRARNQTPETKRPKPNKATEEKWQGRRESNSQPLVLETSALPIELRPCINFSDSAPPIPSRPRLNATKFPLDNRIRPAKPWPPPDKKQGGKRHSGVRTE